MAFTKVRQTVAAFERPRKPTFDDVRRAQHERQVRTAQLGRAEGINIGARLAILLLVVIPVSYAASMLLHKVFHVNYQSVGIITAAIVSYVISALHGKIVNLIERAIPLDKINIVFGSKIEETVAGLRRHRPRRDPKQPQLL